MKTAGAILCVLFLVGCTTAPVSVHKTTNPNVQVELLFEYDGCRVYRFEDDGVHYFSRCFGASTSETFWMQKEGKISLPVEIQTN
jgi:hypothetical protein